ncbi:hypothetical protein B4092_4703 [Bacillus licheniformis]|uniref:hypothetical protein n=1 Tax=Bacillus licheniformis TaxID=1402 RepID=UPI000792D156|nr:hypothetical protein [Bacillus licheniformis]KYC77728.1 hypothetical protein B4092_4703 [Bacillus licheniformis]TWL81264.1 hypothetical protein CHCC15292_4602 [Bacillus licheniformis]
MEEVATLLLNYGGMGAMLVWFMLKQSKDNEQTREILNDLKVLIAKIGGTEIE